MDCQVGVGHLWISLCGCGHFAVASLSSPIASGLMCSGYDTAILFTLDDKFG